MSEYAEMKAQLGSGLGNADKDADGLREKAYQVYINEVTPNGNSRMDNITTCAGPNEGHQRHIATQVDMAFQAGWSAADRADALTAQRSEQSSLKTQDVIAWERLPEWVEWVARDEHGEVWAYDEEPKYRGDGWVFESSSLRIDDFPGIVVQIGTADWRDSKQRRPKVRE